jgi:hypothetical protein
MSNDLMKYQIDVLVNKLDSLKRSHAELQRKYNSLTLWKLLRGNHK